MKRAGKLGIILIVIFGLVMLGVEGWFFLMPVPTIILGEVEATQVKVSSKIAGRLESVLVREGERVQKGQLLLTLESPEIDAKLKQATSAERAAGANREKAFTGLRKQEIQAAQNSWQKAAAGAELAQKTFQRFEKLYAEGVIPAQKLDEAKAQNAAAQQTVEASKALYDMALSGARQEDKDAASALMSQAAGVVSEVEAYLSETRITAPISGEVVEVISEVGEMISPGYPIITILDTSDFWVVFHLREDLLPRFKMGTALVARFPALGDNEYRLKVHYIKALGDFATWRATRAMGGFDLKSFEVRAIPTQPIEGLRPGMSVIVRYPVTESK
jgi:HlyD family secretion protein